MILVISTSSPLLSLAAFKESRCIDSIEQLAPRSAGGVLFEMLEKFLLRNRFKIDDFEGFVSDIGPGSFTGIKSGVTIIKSLGYIHKKPVQGVLSFDLLPVSLIQAISIRKERYFIRSKENILVADKFPENGIGYCLLKAENENIYPNAKNYISCSDWTSSEKLNPLYIEDPNISSPKIPYRIS